MDFLIISAAVASAVILLGYFRPGRFGLVALALAAGYILTLFWTRPLTGLLEVYGDNFQGVSTRSLVFLALMLLPAFLVFLLSEKRRSILPRLISPLFLAVMLVALLLPILPSAKKSRDIGSEVYRLVSSNKEIIITTVLSLGVLDISFSKSQKGIKPTKH